MLTDPSECRTWGNRPSLEKKGPGLGSLKHESTLGQAAWLGRQRSRTLRTDGGGCLSPSSITYQCQARHRALGSASIKCNSAFLKGFLWGLSEIFQCIESGWSIISTQWMLAIVILLRAWKGTLNMFMTKLHQKLLGKQTAYTLCQVLPHLPRGKEGKADSRSCADRPVWVQKLMTCHIQMCAGQRARPQLLVLDSELSSNLYNVFQL